MEFSLCKADKELFAAYFATYYPNIWFRPSWDQLRTIGTEASEGYWITSGGTKFAGVFVDGNGVSCLFALPPYFVENARLVEALVRSLGPARRIYAYCVLEDQVEAFQQAGFQVVETRSCMLRPTEKLNLTSLEDYTVRYPDKEDLIAISNLIYESNAGGVDANSLEKTADSVARYFEINQNSELVLQASSILFDSSGALTGVCLVSTWEGAPLLYELAVKPDCRGQGLGSYMVEKAVDALYGVSPKLRLFVTSGNKAGELYKRLGFLAGGNYSTMSLEATSR